MFKCNHRLRDTIAAMGQPHLQMGRIPPKIIDVSYSTIGPSTLHPYVIGFATNRCQASARITRARTPFFLCSLIGSTVSPKYLPRAVMEDMRYILFLHVWGKVVMCTGDSEDRDQTSICVTRATFLYSADNPTGSDTTTSRFIRGGCCGRKWLSSE
jgi:hypothetical protein